MYLSYRKARERLGDHIVLNVDPAAISHFVRFPLFRIERILSAVSPFARTASRLYRLRPFAVPGGWDRSAVPHHQHGSYRDMAEMVDCDGDFRRTAFYERFRRQLAETGHAAYKDVTITSVPQLDRLFEDRFVALVETMKRDGYDRSISQDIGRVVICRNGGLLKTGSGRHRFHLARILGVPKVPVEVSGVHTAWLRSTRSGLRGARLEHLRRALKHVEERHAST